MTFTNGSTYSYLVYRGENGETGSEGEAGKAATVACYAEDGGIRQC